MNNRKAVETYLYDFLDKLTRTKKNSDLYRGILSKMSDKQFKIWLDKRISGEEIISIIVPNGTDEDIDVEIAMNMAKEVGIEIFGKLTRTTADGGSTTSPVPSLVVDIPISRPSQLIIKKMSVSKDDKTDAITRQVTSSSGSSAISSPEINNIGSMGLKSVGTELFSMRGGDAGVYAYMKASIVATGEVDGDIARRYSTGVGSTNALKTFMVGRHLEASI